METLNFTELNLSKDSLKAISDMGFEKSTPIQSQAIPEMLAGHDIIGQASTGTGKTLAFALPAIEMLNPKSRAPQVIILCPTRELAMQVAVEINKFLKYKHKVSALAIYGGQAISRQIQALRRGVQIIVGTPGRVLDHIGRNTLRLDQVKTVVLDEADEMLNMGFRNDIERILSETKEDRQTVLFSATMSPDIMRLTKHYQKNPKFIKVAQEKVNVSKNVEQIYFQTDSTTKKYLLMHLLNEHKPNLAIIFCNTKRRVDEVAKNLYRKGFLAEGIHGDIRQAKRDVIMSRFRNNKINILVATDVAARGIDVSDIEIVFNYEIPRETESYVHRIGRTGRAGKKGKALSLVSRMDFGRLRSIERYTKTSIMKHETPKLDRVKDEPVKIDRRDEPLKKEIKKPVNKHLEKQANKIFGQIKEFIKKDELTGYVNVMENLLGEKHSSKNVAAALLKMVIDVDSHKMKSSSRSSFQKTELYRS